MLAHQQAKLDHHHPHHDEEDDDIDDDEDLKKPILKRYFISDFNDKRIVKVFIFVIVILLAKPAIDTNASCPRNARNVVLSHNRRSPKPATNATKRSNAPHSSISTSGRTPANGRSSVPSALGDSPRSITWLFMCGRTPENDHSSVRSAASNLRPLAISK